MSDKHYSFIGILELNLWDEYATIIPKVDAESRTTKPKDGCYYLSVKHPAFDAMYATLLYAANNGRRVNVVCRDVISEDHDCWIGGVKNKYNEN